MDEAAGGVRVREGRPSGRPTVRLGTAMAAIAVIGLALGLVVVGWRATVRERRLMVEVELSRAQAAVATATSLRDSARSQVLVQTLQREIQVLNDEVARLKADRDRPASDRVGPKREEGP